MTSGAAGKFRSITSSILATESDQKLAHDLYESARTGSAEALSQLADLEAEIARRGMGVRDSVLVVPRQANVAEPMISGLQEFATAINSQLDSQLHLATAARNAWLKVVSRLIVVMLVSGVVCGVLGMIGTVPVAGLPFAALGFAVLVAGVVFAYRVFHMHEVRVQRLNEKKAALEFLTAAVKLTASAGQAAPAVSPVLERAFGMFLTHYEAETPPLTASDLATGPLSGK